MGSAFLQTRAASELKKLSITMDLSEADRDVLASFLSNGEGDSSEYNPASGEITGILKQMKETMEKDLGEAEAAESTALKDFEALTAAKEKQVATLTKEIESKMMRSGEAGVELANMQEDLSDTQKSLTEDKKFLVDVKTDCKTKEAEKETNDKTRADELLALADTIRLLNDDDALELFKKTLPGASALIQLESTAADAKGRALTFIQEAQRTGKGNAVNLDLIAMALKGKKAGFEKIIKLIDDMVVTLKKEQDDDDSKKEYCLSEFDTNEDKKKETERAISDLETKIADTEESIQTLADEIKALQEGIFDLDKQVIKATEQRKEENAAYTDLMASNSAAVEIIGIAKNRMQKFYNPKLYKPPPKRELTEEERITLNMGGTLAPTNP